MIEFSKELLELDGIEDSLPHIEKFYEYNGSRVPRVTQILQQCEDQQGLIKWAVGVGYRKYNEIREKSLEVGTIVHESIDHYLIDKYKYGKDFMIEYDTIQENYRSAVYTSFENFKLWEHNLNNLGYSIEELVGIEIPIITPWYGGTIDAIFKINGVYYIIDFKTSKQISNSYLIQTAAYMWGVNSGYGENLPTIGGIGIIRADKTNYGIIDDLFLTVSDPYQNKIINDHILCFYSYLEAYYRTLSINHQDNKYKDSYDIRGVL